ncbi:hypothetical protein LXL04_002659 [Taraxacum kok-saghyz]
MMTEWSQSNVVGARGLNALYVQESRYKVVDPLPPPAYPFNFTKNSLPLELIISIARVYLSPASATCDEPEHFISPAATPTFELNAGNTNCDGGISRSSYLGFQKFDFWAVSRYCVSLKPLKPDLISTFVIFILSTPTDLLSLLMVVSFHKPPSSRRTSITVILCFSKTFEESTISSIREWLSNDALGNNPILRLIAGTIFMHEQDYNEVLKHTNAGGSMELLSFTFSHSLNSLSLSLILMHHVLFRYALNVHIFLKMHRSDYAEKQLRVMQQIDEDHTLTQLATALLNLAVGGSKRSFDYISTSAQTFFLGTDFYSFFFTSTAFT